MNLRNGYRILKAAVMDFIDDNAMTLGAALASYSALSMAPLILILLAITALLGPGVQKWVVQQVETTVGAQASSLQADSFSKAAIFLLSWSKPSPQSSGVGCQPAQNAGRCGWL